MFTLKPSQSFLECVNALLHTFQRKKRQRQVYERVLWENVWLVEGVVSSMERSQSWNALVLSRDIEQ